MRKEVKPLLKEFKRTNVLFVKNDDMKTLKSLNEKDVFI